MCAVGAVMRKLLILAYGVLKNREKFDANRLSRKREKEQVSELQSCASPT